MCLNKCGLLHKSDQLQMRKYLSLKFYLNNCSLMLCLNSFVTILNEWIL